MCSPATNARSEDLAHFVGGQSPRIGSGGSGSGSCGRVSGGSVICGSVICGSGGGSETCGTVNGGSRLPPPGGSVVGVAGSPVTPTSPRPRPAPGDPGAVVDGTPGT